MRYMIHIRLKIKLFKHKKGNMETIILLPKIQDAYFYDKTVLIDI